MDALRAIRLLVVALTVAGALVACGGDDDASDDDAPEVFEDPPRGGECDGLDLEFTNLSTGESIDLEHAGAISLSDGAAWTAYLADFELTDDDFGIAGATVPDGGNLVTLAVTVFDAEGTPEPIEEGTEITYTDEFGELTFVVTHQQGTETFGTNTGAAGTVTLTNVSDMFCAEVEYADDEKELSGTIEAEIERSL